MALIELQVLDASEKIAPKSVLRHRPIGNGYSKPSFGRHSITTNATVPTVQRASRPRSSGESQDDIHIREWRRVDQDDQEKEVQAKAPKDSAGVKRFPITSRPALMVPRPVPITPMPKLTRRAVRTTQQAHPLLYLGVGMIAMLLLWAILSSVFGWFATTMDDIRYGRPRTFQTDQWVGHNEQTGVASHFIAINLNRRIEIIELPGGDASHAKVYLGPQLYGANDDLAPITLTFADIKGNHKLDMIVNFQGTHIVFINDQGGFRPLLPSEHHQAEQFLQHAHL